MTTSLENTLAQLVEDNGAWTVTDALRTTAHQRAAFVGEQGHANDPMNATGWKEEQRNLYYLEHLLAEAIRQSVPKPENDRRGKNAGVLERVNAAHGLLDERHHERRR